MQTRTVLAVALTAGGVAMCVWLAPPAPVPLVPRAIGQETQQTQRFRQRLQQADTWFVHAPYRHPGIRLKHGLGTPIWFMRWDAARGVGSIEGAWGVKRLAWWGGEASRDVNPEPSDEPLDQTQFYGPVVDSAIAELWTEVRAGLPTTAFLFTYPGEEPLAGDWLSDAAWEVVLPFPWAEPYRVFIDLDDGGSPTVFGVVTAGPNPKWIFQPTWLRVEWNVPLRDDFDRREGYRKVPGGMVWHSHGAVKSVLTFLPDQSTAEPILHRDGAPPTSFTAAVWDAPCVTGQTTTAPVLQVWRWDSSSDNSDRAAAAMAAGCTLTLSVHGETRYTLTPGARAWFDGTLSLRDDAGSVLASRDLSSEHTAPPDGSDQRWTPQLRELEVPQGQHQVLQVILEGTIGHECTQAGPANNQVAISTNDLGRPTLRWPECWPEIGVTN